MEGPRVQLLLSCLGLTNIKKTRNISFRNVLSCLFLANNSFLAGFTFAHFSSRTAKIKCCGTGINEGLHPSSDVAGIQTGCQGLWGDQYDAKIASTRTSQLHFTTSTSPTRSQKRSMSPPPPSRSSPRGRASVAGWTRWTGPC